MALQRGFGGLSTRGVCSKCRCFTRNRPLNSARSHFYHNSVLHTRQVRWHLTGRVLLPVAFRKEQLTA